MRNVTVSSDPSISHLVVSWILMIPFVCFASDGLLWFRSGNNELTSTFGLLGGAQAGTQDYTAISILLFAIVPVVLFPKIKPVIELCRRDRVFAALAVWTVLSCFWSQFPMVSLEWAPVAVLDIVFAFYLYRRFTPGQQMRLLLLFGWLCLLLSIALSLFFPQYGIDHTGTTGAWRGMYPQKNMCSMTTAFLMLGALYAPATSFLFKVSRVAYVCLSVFLIIMTQSATGKITLVCLLAYFVATRLASGLRSRERAVALAMGTMIALALVGIGISEREGILLLLGKDSTLTSRTEIWKAIIPSIMKHPILGYGIKAFWRGYQGESANVSLAAHWAVPSAHNALLEVWLGLGAVGVALVAYSMVRAIRDAFVCLRAGKSPYLAWCACLIFLTIITSLDEAELVTPYSLSWILYILACLGLSEGARRIRLGLDCG